MRCSSCEPLLDDFLEGTLMRAEMRAVAHHLRRCRFCEGFLAELRVVDALLTTARAPGSVGSDFTAAIVSATQHAQPHRLRRVPLWVALLAYLVTAWGALAYAARGGELGAYVSGILNSGQHGAAAIEAALQAVGPVTAPAAAAVMGVLTLDLLLLCLLVFAYRRLRPMLALYLARGPRS